MPEVRDTDGDQPLPGWKATAGDTQASVLCHSEDLDTKKTWAEEGEKGVGSKTLLQRIVRLNVDPWCAASGKIIGSVFPDSCGFKL